LIHYPSLANGNPRGLLRRIDEFEAEGVRSACPFDRNKYRKNVIALAWFWAGRMIVTP
jgi:hypothetical protein